MTHENRKRPELHQEISLGEAARLLGRSVQSLRRERAAGGFIPIMGMGKRSRVRVEDLQTYQANRYEEACREPVQGTLEREYIRRHLDDLPDFFKRSGGRS